MYNTLFLIELKLPPLRTQKLKVIITKKNRWENRNLYFKKEPKHTLLSCTKPHHLTLVYCRQHDSATRLPCPMIRSPHCSPVCSLIHVNVCTQSHPLFWCSQLNRKSDLSVKRVIGHYQWTKSIPLDEDTVILKKGTTSGVLGLHQVRMNSNTHDSN